MQESNHLDPENQAQLILTKSFLKSRNSQRETVGSQFFKDNKIRSCSYVKASDNTLKAVPFYDKRDKTIYPTPSTVTRSWNATVHSNNSHLHAGMGRNKSLMGYHPNESRNCMAIPDFRSPYPNSSQIEVGKRDQRDSKHYITNYGNSFIAPKQNVPTNHPGIEAYRNKWLRSRLAM